MSFMLTTAQIRAQTKTQTRRLGWLNLKPGTLLRAVHKCQGLRAGEHPEELAIIRVKDARLENLCDISAEDVVAEGFPEMTPKQFVSMFCEHMKCDRIQIVTRIEFEYV